MALIRVADENESTPLKLFDDTSESVGGIQEVIVLGNPGSKSFYATKGIVSRVVVGCKLFRSPDREDLAYNFGTAVKCIEHDAATFGGSSGGPVLSAEGNQKGKVLGVTHGGEGIRVARSGDRSGDVESIFVPYTGLSSAIHYQEIRAFLDEYAAYRASTRDSL